MKNARMTVVGSLVLFLFSNCTHGPEYTAPKIEAPGQFVSQAVFDEINQQPREQPVDVTEIFPKNWWQGFDDPILNQLVEEALQSNYSISRSAARLNAAWARLRLVDSRDSIQASVDMDTGTQGRSEFGEDEDASASADLFGSFSVVWPVDVSGRVENQVAAARAEVEGASAALRGVILAVSADVTSEYLRLRGNQRQLALLKESVELQKQTLAIVQSRYEAGLAPELDLKRAEAAVASLQADIPPLQEKLINSRNRLATLTGHFPGKYEKLLKEEKGIPTYQSQIPTMLPMRVLTLRPDIRQAEAELKRAAAEIGVAEAEWSPTVQLMKQMRLGTTGISEGPTLGILVSSIGVLIQQVLSDGGAREAQLAIAESQVKETLARYRENLIVAMEEVEFSLAALASSLDRQKSLAQAVEASNRSFFQAESLYRQGLTSFIDVVDAQRVLASAQQKLASAKTNYASQIANLFYVLGTDVTL